MIASKIIMEPSGYVCLESYQFEKPEDKNVYYKRIDFDYFFENVIDNQNVWEILTEFDSTNLLKRHEAMFNITNILLYFNIWYYRGKESGLLKSFNDTTIMAILAYMLATIRVETASAYNPVRETEGVVSGGFGSKASFSYLSKKVGIYKNDDDWIMMKDYEEQKEYKIPIYYGRGLCQITHRYHYEKIKSHIEWYIEHEKIARALYDWDTPMEGTWDFSSIDSNAIKFPDCMLKWSYAFVIAFDFSLNGNFTGVPITKYINDNSVDYVNARRVISGIDGKTEYKIAKWAEIFKKGLKMKDYLYTSNELSSYLSGLNLKIYS